MTEEERQELEALRREKRERAAEAPDLTPPAPRRAERGVRRLR